MNSRKQVVFYVFLSLFVFVVLKGGIIMAGCKGKKVLMIIAKDGFRDEEYIEPRQILESAGVNITVASSSSGDCKGMLGMNAKADISLSSVIPSEYDGVIFVGGAGSREFWDDEKAHSIAKSMFQDGKLVAAICIAPVTLANAGLLDGKKATVWSSEAKSIEQKGAIYTGAGVECDGNIVTANGPTSAREFGKKILDKLCKE